MPCSQCALRIHGGTQEPFETHCVSIGIGRRTFCRRLRIGINGKLEGSTVVKFLVWCLLLVFCWPLAILAIVLYPLVWLILLPFRLIGVAVEGALQVVSAIIFLPPRILRAI